MKNVEKDEFEMYVQTLSMCQLCKALAWTVNDALYGDLCKPCWNAQRRQIAQ